ncbi:MAG TPA: RNA polymerase sigma factor [Methylovirgula sp.]|jgi:RNA polymerase sigma factor (sigma-70 family)|nr:RNA polymerase sigma factor [Methylovirgula sp.]
MPPALSHAIDAIWRIESAQVIATLARMVRDVGLAEDLAQEALVAALTQWPDEGVPDKPGAWLTAVGKRRAVDMIRRNKLMADKQHLLAEDDISEEPELKDRDDVEDDLLRLIFVACHPLLSREARIALSLRLLGGLTTDEIARAFLVPEPTIAQRIVRAKRTLSDAGVAFEVPRGQARAERLPSVLEVIYLIFNEGYAATAGDDWMRPQLCQEAMRLGRILAHRMPDDAQVNGEVHGLVALMELQASRFPARTGRDGEPILLLEQNRARWDHVLIRHGLAALTKAEAMSQAGIYTLQAAIAACHARASTAEQTDWIRIAALYAALGQVMPSPVVELNRAVAVGKAFGPQSGLDIVDALMDDASLKHYHLLPAVRGDLLEELGRRDEARAEFERAAALTHNNRERELMLKRARAISTGGEF